MSRARRAVDELLKSIGNPDGLRFNLHLVISELVSNAILHGSPDELIRVDLTLHRDCVRISVRSGGGIEMNELRRGSAKGGRGLEIVAALAGRWIIDSGPPGTTLTAIVPRAS